MAISGGKGNCRALVEFDGTGAISANQTVFTKKNVAYVFKNATGDYTIGFNAGVNGGNYVVNGIAKKDLLDGKMKAVMMHDQQGATNSFFRVLVVDSAGVNVDSDSVHISVFVP